MHSAVGQVLTAVEPGTTPIDKFGDEPFWATLIKVVGVFLVAMAGTIFMIIWERKLIAKMQFRLGPNRHGPNGWFQSVADAIKLLMKEDFIPAMVDRPVYVLAPILTAVPALLVMAVTPFGPTVNMFGYQIPLQVTDLPVGVLWVLAMSATGVYGTVLAGWASNSTYALLGGLRAAAQMISYEVAMGLSLVGVFLYAGSMSTSQIVAAQTDTWFMFALLPSFVIYCISAVAETNRVPFALPEAEGELVAGHMTEYTSLKFGMFFLAEYIHMIAVSALATTLFLGGWHVPFGLEKIWPFLNTGYLPLLWFFAKVGLFLAGFVWLRATLPRFRYDQLMKFGWKVLMPINLGWILLISAVRTFSREYAWNTQQAMLYVGIPVVIILAVMLFWPQRKEPAEPVEGEEGFVPQAYPTPPMDLVVPPSPRLAAVSAGAAGPKTESLAAGASSAEPNGKA